ncbi:MAG: polysaccharide biosynthesis tyrosine autokinase [Myxococcales bacterium]|nr:polysaccharide biosynthesis tyrosine autokinase [Myxococcales bacterium]
MFEEEDVQPIHLGDYFKVLKKRKWTSIILFVIIVVAVEGYAFYLTPQYTATASVLMGRSMPSAAGFQQEMLMTTASQGLLDRKEYQANQMEIIQSHQYGKMIMDRLNLWDEYTPEETWFTDLKRTWFGSTEDPVENFLENLEIDRANTLVSLIEISFTHTDPQMAADVVNTLLEIYIDQTQQSRIAELTNSAEALAPEIESLRRELRAKQLEMETYRRENNAFSLKETNNIAAQRLLELNAATTSAKVERLVAEANYKKAIELQQSMPESLDTLPQILVTPTLQALKTQLLALESQASVLAERYKPDHPKMLQARAQIAEMRGKVRAELDHAIDGLIHTYDVALAKERAMLDELRGQQNVIGDLNQKQAMYNILQQEVQTQQIVYQQLISRQHEANIAARLIPVADQIIDYAHPPEQPSKPRKWLYLCIALGAGLVLSLAFAFLFEYFDRTVKSMKDIEHDLRTHVLGIVPKVKWLAGLRRIRPYTVAKDFPYLPVVEYFRHINGSIEGVTADHPVRSILVTSTSPREGKSVVATNLGITLAQDGKRVLMIEADLRKPMTCRAFGIPEPAEGLTTVVRGENTVDEVIQATDQANLFVLPAGPEPPSPAEIFKSPEMAALLKKLEQSYDLVILDSPPILEVSDSVTLSKIVDGVVWVLSSGQTEKERAAWAKRALDTIGARILGIVLNNVRHPRGTTGYYSRS